jgi:hypothetical protein
VFARYLQSEGVEQFKVTYQCYPATEGKLYPTAYIDAQLPYKYVQKYIKAGSDETEKKIISPE